MTLAGKIVGVAGTAAAVYADGVRPRLMHWGATDEEVAGRYPGADLVPGLVEVAKRVDAEDAIFGHVAVADATGLSPDDVCRAARSLERKGLIEYDDGWTGSIDFRDMTGEAYTLTGFTRRARTSATHSLRC